MSLDGETLYIEVVVLDVKILSTRGEAIFLLEGWSPHKRGFSGFLDEAVIKQGQTKKQMKLCSLVYL
jgi:hypothetical protein